jgi:hypothetical protein
VTAKSARCGGYTAAVVSGVAVASPWSTWHPSLGGLPAMAAGSCWWAIQAIGHRSLVARR